MASDLVERELVVLVGPRGVYAPESGGGHRLPVIGAQAWPTLVDLQSAVDVPHAVLIGPPCRYDHLPGTTLHVLSDPYDEASGRPDQNWVPLRDLELLGEDAAVNTGIRTVVDQATGRRERPPRRPDWLRTDWTAEVDAWIDDRLVECGLRRNGRTVPFQMWSISAVLKTPVIGPDGSQSTVVHKASCARFAAEPLITELVGRFSGGCTPEVLAVDADRSWALMRELDDTSYEEDLDHRRDLALATAPLAARLQLAMLDRLDELRAAGCPDRTSGPTLEALTALLEDGDVLEPLAPDELRMLREQEPLIRAALADLSDCGIPPALVHGDLHLGNVARSRGGRPVIYDWSDACIGHPFVDAVHIALRVREEDRQAVYEAFVGPWREAFPAADLETALALAVTADNVFHALSYESIQRFQEDASRWEMAGDAAHFLRRLIDVSGSASA